METEKEKQRTLIPKTLGCLGVNVAPFFTSDFNNVKCKINNNNNNKGAKFEKQ